MIHVKELPPPLISRKISIACALWLLLTIVLSICALTQKLNMNKETIRQMLHDNLNMWKICAKVVPKTSHPGTKTDEKINLWLDELSSHWIWDLVLKYDLETHKQSQQWVEKGGERPTKTKMSEPQLKAILIVFFFQYLGHHPLQIRSLQPVTGKFYVGILERLQAHVIWVQPKHTKESWILHHDNASSHLSFIVYEFLAHEKYSNIATPTL